MDLHPGLYTLEITVNSKERMIMKLLKGLEIHQGIYPVAEMPEMKALP